MPLDPWPAPTPSTPVHAQVRVPGSKSLTNRALVLAAIAEGPSEVGNALRSRDTLLMVGALETLGARVDTTGPTWQVTPATWAGGGEVDCGLAGTVMRFVPPLAGLCSGRVDFDGDPHARRRPMTATIDALRQLGVEVDDGGRSALPFSVHGTGAVTGGEVRLDASSSSQFVSALLLAAPRYSRGVTVRHLGPPVPSRPHLDMTVAALRARGVEVDDSTQDVWVVTPGPVAAHDVAVEPDLSNAAPFLAAALVTGGEVTVRDWPRETTQPGALLPEIFARMGATSRLADDGLRLTGPRGDLTGLELDMSQIGELAPVIAAVCALAGTGSRLRGLAHIRGHETDRLRALATELSAAGAHVQEHQDGLDIAPGPMRGRVVETYDDHRMAHAAAVIGLRVPGVMIRDVATTAKTFPGFEQAWDELAGPTAGAGAGE